MPAVEKLLQPRAAANVQRSNALRRIKLVSGERKQIETERINVNRKLARGLHCVGMKVDVGVRGDAANFLERLHRAQFVVGLHYCDQHGLLANRLAQSFHRNKSLTVNRQIGDSDALLLERLT